MTAEAPRNLGPKPRLEFHPPTALTVDPRYQRNTDSAASKAVIRKIVERFYWPFFGVIMATDNGDGTYCIIDGQHRAEAAKQIPEIRAVPVMVVEEMTLAEQAQAFITVNQNRVRLNALQIHRAAVRAGEENAVTLDRVAKGCGLKIPGNVRAASEERPGEALCVKALASILRAHGPDHLALVINTTLDAFERNSSDLRSQVFKAVSAAIMGGTNAREVKNVLRNDDAASWIIRAQREAQQTGSDTVTAFAEILSSSRRAA